MGAPSTSAQQRAPSGLSGERVLKHGEAQTSIRYTLTSLYLSAGSSSSNWQVVMPFVADKTEPILVTGKSLKGLIV